MVYVIFFELVMFEQKVGISKWSLLYSLIANIFTENFEEKRFPNCTDKRKMWLQCMNDVLHGVLLIAQEEIKFTIEKEVKQKLLFLDLELQDNTEISGRKTRASDR